MRRSIIFLGGGKDAVKIVFRAVEMGLHPVVVDKDPRCPARHLGVQIVQASCYDWKDTLNGLRVLDILPSAVMCAGTDAPDVAAAVASHYGLVGLNASQVRQATDKYYQKMDFLMSGVNVPSFWRADEADALQDFPIVLKPIRGRGARGVFRILNQEQYATITGNVGDSFGPMMAEHWVDGVQLSSESIVINGKVEWTAFAERNYSRLDEFAPHVIEDGSDTPPAMPDYFENSWSEKANEQLQKCADVFGMKNGTMKGDLVWTGQDIFVIEVALRLSGGEFCSVIIPEVWGADMVGVAIRMALGENVYPGEIRPYLRRHARQRFSFPVRPLSHPERGASVIGYGMNREKAQNAAETLLASLEGKRE